MQSRSPATIHHSLLLPSANNTDVRAGKVMDLHRQVRAGRLVSGQASWLDELLLANLHGRVRELHRMRHIGF